MIRIEKICSVLLEIDSIIYKLHTFFFFFKSIPCYSYKGKEKVEVFKINSYLRNICEVH